MTLTKEERKMLTNKCNLKKEGMPHIESICFHYEQLCKIIDAHEPDTIVVNNVIEKWILPALLQTKRLRIESGKYRADD